MPPPPQFANWRVTGLRIALGLFLLIAAGLKVQGLSLDPFAKDSLLASPRLQIATIEVEVLLGLWLLSGVAVRASWAMALGFFALLAGVSCYQALAGQASCGCFGLIAVNPWWTFGVDMAVIAALVFWRPRFGGAPDWQALRLCTPCFVGAAMILAGITWYLHDQFGSTRAGLARLRGDAIAIFPEAVDAGEAVRGELRVINVELVNVSDHPVSIIG